MIRVNVSNIEWHSEVTFGPGRIRFDDSDTVFTYEKDGGIYLFDSNLVELAPLLVGLGIPFTFG